MRFKRFWIITVLTILTAGMIGCGTPDTGEVEQEVVTNEQPQADEDIVSEDVTVDVPEEDAEASTVQTVDGDMTVHFLDVGQGNSVLVECDGRYMLVDGGENDYSSYVVAYLKKQGVETLDYMVVSHYDSDHLSGCVGAMRVFDIGTVICPDYEGDTKTYYTFIDDLVKYEIAHVNPEVGETYTLGDAMFTIVCPEEYDYSDENDNSVGIRLEFGSNSFLICGDAGEESEEDMLRSGVLLQSDVYMAGHHGSSGSSTYDFLQAVQPEVVVISCGFDNSYGHPAKATMNRLQKTGADLYRTDLQGELIAVSDGTNITWNVEPSNDFRCGEDVVAGTSTSKPEAEAPQSGDAAVQNTTTGNNASSATYILNVNTGKFHIPSCSSVDDMNESNKKEVSSTISEMESKGYSPCKRCLD